MTHNTSSLFNKHKWKARKV